MSDFLKIASLSDVPSGKMKGFVVSGKKVLVVNLNGKLYAVSSLCTHVGGPLDKGTLENNVVTCPWHGSKFDVITGAVVNGPANKGIEKFELKVEGKDILIKL